jgi:acetoacetyl-CoA synthetase
MGSSEIYSAVEELPEILDSLIVGFESTDGEYHMPLFVVVREGVEFDENLKMKINHKIRNSLSPRHVPDEIYTVVEIPKTLNDKKLEVPVKRILMGVPSEKAVNVDSMRNPDSIQFFVDLAKKFG